MCRCCREKSLFPQKSTGKKGESIEGKERWGEKESRREGGAFIAGFAVVVCGRREGSDSGRRRRRTFFVGHPRSAGHGGRRRRRKRQWGGRSLGGGFCGNVEYVYTQGERIISGVFPLFSLGKMMCGMRRSLPREDEKEAVRRGGEER